MDVNAEYKDRFRTLAVQLGRPPDTRDKEYWELADWQRNAYRDGGVGMPEVWKEEERLASQTRGRRFSREPAPQASVISAREGRESQPEALRRPRAAEDGIGGGSAPETASELPGASQAAQRHCQRCRAGLRDEQGRLRVHACPDLERALGLVGSRGPGGGMVARCSACDRLWERPRQRGRPPMVCQSCR